MIYTVRFKTSSYNSWRKMISVALVEFCRVKRLDDKTEWQFHLLCWFRNLGTFSFHNGDKHDNRLARIMHRAWRV